MTNYRQLHTHRIPEGQVNEFPPEGTAHLLHIERYFHSGPVIKHSECELNRRNQVDYGADEGHYGPRPSHSGTGWAGTMNWMNWTSAVENRRGVLVWKHDRHSVNPPNSLDALTKMLVRPDPTRSDPLLRLSSTLHRTAQPKQTQ